MTTFNVEDMKFTFMNSIRTYVYPQQLNHVSSISLFNEGSVVTQEFYPFSDSINSCGIYVTGTIGTPSELTLEILSGNKTLTTGTVPGTVGWNTLDSVSVADVVTARLSTLRITGNVSSGNDYYIGTDTVSSYFYSTITPQVAFTIGVSDFIYKVFPMKEIEQRNLPVAVVDVSGRPRIVDKYLSGDNSWLYITLKCDVYSKYTHEVDKIAYGIERGIYKNRKSFSDVYYVSPGLMSPIGYVNPDVFNRYFTWTVQQLIARE